MDLNDILMNLAVESGEIAAPVEEVVEEPITTEELAVSELVTAGAKGLPDEVEHAEKAADIAEQLDELAERAEELAGEDKAYLDQVASTESLHREYRAIMRANDLKLPAHSFESAGSDKGRLQGLAEDARRAAKVTRGYRDSVMDFSPEGKILQFLRNDEAKLAHAEASLASAEKAIHGVGETLREGAVAIKHDGIKHFMTQGGEPIHNLGNAIADEAKWLKQAHDYVNASAAVLLQAATKLGSGDPAVALKAVRNMRVPSENISTGKDDLMGSATITATDTAGGNFHIPKYSRDVPAVEGQLAAAVKGAVIGSLTNMGWLIVGGAVAGVVGLVGNPIVAGAVIGHAAYRGAQAVHKSVREDLHGTKVTSAAGYSDILKAIQSVRGYTAYTNFKVDDDAWEKALKLAKGNIGSLQGDEKKEASKIISEIEQGFARLARLMDAMYEQAFMTTIMMAGLMERVARAAKKQR